MKGVDVEDGTLRPGSGTTSVMEDAKRCVTWCDMGVCLSITLFRLSYLAYVEEFYKTQITTAMQISRISQYHNVQNGEDVPFSKLAVRNMQLRCAGTDFFLLKSTHSDTII